MGIILSCFAYLRTLFLNCSKCFSTTSSISSSDYELQIRPAPGDRSTSEVENLGDAQPSSSNIRPFAQALSSATFGELVSGFTPNPNAPGAALRVAFRVPRLDLASRMLHEIALTVEGAGYHNEKYRILCNRCREVLEAIQAGWDPDAEARLNPVLTRLLGFLEGIHGAIKSWASLNEIASLQSTPTIINEIKVKFYDLDAFLEEFGVIHTVQPRGRFAEFETACKVDSDHLIASLGISDEPPPLAQVLDSQENAQPGQDVSSPRQSETPTNPLSSNSPSPDKAGQPPVDTSVPIAISAAYDKIASTAAAAQNNLQKLKYLQRRCEKIIAACQGGWNLEIEAQGGQIIELFEKIHSSIIYWTSLDIFESFIQQFSIASDIKAKVKALDEFIPIFSSHMRPRDWDEFSLLTASDSSALAKDLKSRTDMMDLDDNRRKAIDELLGGLQTALKAPPQGSTRQEMQQNILTVQNTFDVCLPDTKILVGAECKIVDYDLFATTESYDVLKGLWMGSRSVGLKIWSEIQSGEFDQYEGHCMRQVKIWCTLYHQHISPFYGLCRAYGPYSCLVLPWKGEGQAIQYLSEKPASSLIKVCLEAAYGLQYLHSLARPIVLGGLRRSGILISDEGKALLADFEISDFEGSSYDSYAARRGKWDRWLAPELAEEGPDGTPSRLTKACDIWSWAMMVLEVLSEKSPFFASESGTTEEQESLRQRIRDGERPTRDEYTHPALEDSLWLLLESCWQTEPKDRPDIDAVVATMKTISTSYQEPPPPLLPS